MRAYFVSTLIYLLSKYLDLLLGVEREDQQMEDGMAGAWMSPWFRKYIGFRAQKIRFAMSGGEGMKLEPRLEYTLHAGQLVEILLLGQRAKQAWERKEKNKELSTPP